MILTKTTKDIIIKGDLDTLLDVKKALSGLEIQDFEVKVNIDPAYLTIKFERTT